jgi:glucosamine--fructose-6-phosphate aminotransferase (isomerizing)
MSYRATIARQPQSLADSIATARSELTKLDLAPLKSGVIAVTGIGASFAAATVVSGELVRQGRRAFPVRCTDLGGGGLADCIVALSHRGTSVETVEALTANPGAVKLALTKDPESPLARAAGRHLTINNGSDATPSSTGYTGALVAAGLMVDRLCDGETDWERLPIQASEVLQAAEAKMAKLRRTFADRRAIDCVGAGPALGAADEASLLIREAARIPASPAETRHYLHGPMESADAGAGVVIFGKGREIEIARQLQAIGCPVLLVTTRADVAEGPLLTVVSVPAHENVIAQGILDILTAQLLAAELSDAAELTDTKFRYPQTDTKIKAT